MAALCRLHGADGPALRATPRHSAPQANHGASDLGFAALLRRFCCFGRDGQGIALPAVELHGQFAQFAFGIVQRIFAQQREGVASKRVGLLPQERVPVREGAEIVDAQGAVIGKVSSGGFGPSLGAPVAMGYVASAHATLDSEVFAMVRGKRVPMKVARTPFVPQRYYRG